MADEFCIQNPAWNKTLQFSLPLMKRSHLTLRHQHSGASETTYFAPNIEFFFSVCSFAVILVPYSIYSLVHYLQCIFNIYLFQPNACFFSPRTKWTQPMSKKHCQPRWHAAFIISKLNVPSLQNSPQGCKTNVSVCKLWSLTSLKRQMLHKHANWIFGRWISVIRLGWKLSAFYIWWGLLNFIHPKRTVLQLSVLDISSKHGCLGVWYHLYAWSTWHEGMHMRCVV